MLDLRTIIESQRALKTLLHLFFSPNARKMIKMQRRTRVIDLHDSDGSADQRGEDSEESKTIEEELKYLQKIQRAGAHDDPRMTSADNFARLERGVFIRSALDHKYLVADSQEQLEDYLSIQQRMEESNRTEHRQEGTTHSL